MGAKSREKDQNMAAVMKANGEERRTGRCAMCYNMIPNGLFYPAAWDQHLMKCPGPRRKEVYNPRTRLRAA